MNLTNNAHTTGPLAHVPAELYGAHVIGRPATEFAPIRPDLPSGRRRPGIPGRVARVKAAKILGTNR